MTFDHNGEKGGFLTFDHNGEKGGFLTILKSENLQNVPNETDFKTDFRNWFQTM